LGLVASRRGQSDSRSRLILGPWIHGIPGTGERSQRAGERVFGAKAGLDYDEEILRFMDRYVRGIANGLEREPRIRVFVMGENEWRASDVWPLPGTERIALHLGAPIGEDRGRLSRGIASGRAASTFVSDPRKPVTDPFFRGSGAHDYREIPSRSDLLTFETEPLAENLRVIGNITAEIYLSTDARDADLWVRLFDVAPDGTAWNLMSPGLEAQRASYRDGGPERKLLEPGQVYRLTLGNILTGNLFRRGHRLRAVVSATFLPHLGPNLHTGDLETASAQTRTARITIHHDREHPSRIVLPVLR
jgi:putative CocE/NonD family hydrolase